ncbi:DoxX family protein [Bacillus sp. FJAT-42315]|uniref:DoxX family protein n=1 Tax=Bacillus sp. FJAT-42315 TaxID=2014077 RepID=UPI000C24DF71|nr:DoxX family protein [Bacillus sp. FJAT-42315]
MTKKHELGALILRVILGLTFFVHGLAKFQGGIENIAGWFDSIGLPSFMAYIVAAVELVGGVALILGLGTRIIAGLFVIVMLVAISKVKIAAGFMGNGEMAGYELDLALLAMSVYLVIAGSSLYSLGQLVLGKDSKEK